MSEEELKDALHSLIRQHHHEGTLQHLIGDALGKNAVIIVLIDAVGAVTVVADNRANLDNSERDRHMVLQMTKLLSTNMQNMMTAAGKATKKDG